MTPETISAKDILTPEQVAKILHVCKDTVYELCDSGEIPCLYIKNRRRIPAWKLMAWLDASGKKASDD
jgi:excisionase family DNA binding protein